MTGKAFEKRTSVSALKTLVTGATHSTIKVVPLLTKMEVTVGAKLQVVAGELKQGFLLNLVLGQI